MVPTNHFAHLMDERTLVSTKGTFLAVSTKHAVGIFVNFETRLSE